MKYLYLFICILFLTTCKKEKYSIQNLNGNSITVMGHGGMGFESLYPLNSAEGILNCLNLGADGSEMDIQMTKDSVMVLFHDQDLSETTNLKGNIHSLNWSEIKDAYYTISPYQGFTISTLDDLLASVKNVHDYSFSFDCKLYKREDQELFEETFIRTLQKVIEKYNLENNVYIESQSQEFINRYKSYYPDMRLFIYTENFAKGLDFAKSKSLYGIFISTKYVTKEEIKLAHDNNLRVAIWGITSEKGNIESIKKNPDIIQTDKLRHLLKELDR
ncbi:MAG: glycerophosphodiester phosphodiesterase family protein [Cytophagaceae bacterium]|nr:glycerophosphodiester phosphodiesterase family protein [Cytophagaceae bacterium]